MTQWIRELFWDFCKGMLMIAALLAVIRMADTLAIWSATSQIARQPTLCCAPD